MENLWKNIKEASISLPRAIRFQAECLLENWKYESSITRIAKIRSLLQAQAIPDHDEQQIDESSKHEPVVMNDNAIIL